MGNRQHILLNGIALLLGGLLFLWFGGCGTGEDPMVPGDPAAEASGPLTLLALGDSYTKGESVRPGWSWPYQLADSLTVAGDTLQSLEVVAETGWTTRDLLAGLRARRDELNHREYGLVTLMIGVNNQFQHLPTPAFAADMDTLLALSLELAGGDAGRVLGFSIPDYGATPVGGLYGAQTIAAELAGFNAILAQKYQTAGITMLDVTTLSLLVADDPALVSRDGLHYSATMYGLWVQMMLPHVRGALELP